MTQIPKNRYSIGRLLQILQNPGSKATPKRRQPLLDREQIRKKMTLKWKDPGFCNLEFSKSSSVRGQLLNEWELERIALAERSYMTPKESRPYAFDRQSREFPKVTLRLYPKKFQRYLKTVEAEKQDLLFKEKHRVIDGLTKMAASMAKQNKQKNHNFMPASTSTKIFGFSTKKSGTSGSRIKNKHFKTLNI